MHYVDRCLIYRTQIERETLPCRENYHYKEEKDQWLTWNSVKMVKILKS